MKLSIIIPVLNSHEIVRRQLLFWQRSELPTADMEIVIVDDGSSPPLTADLPGVRVHATHDYRPWTQPFARNAGARVATGQYLWMTDIDYILPACVVQHVLAFDGHKMAFRRALGVLDDHGRFRDDHATLRQYGVPMERLAAKGIRISSHPTTIVIRADLFWKMGGYRETIDYPQREEADLKRKWKRLEQEEGVYCDSERPLIYMFPNGRFCGHQDSNPFGLFHGLRRCQS